MIRYLIFVIGLATATYVSADGPLQKISAKGGTLFFEDGREVRLWGVNFQSCISWEHAARMQDQNLLMPLNSQDLKRVTDKSFMEVQRLGVDLIRVHLTPADFTDRQGNLVETFWLDMLDYTLAAAQQHELYVYLTFLNHMPHGGTQFPPDPDSFAAVFPREEWLVDPAAIAATENCIRQLLNRRNPYNGRLYKEHAALALVEPVNEPDYIWYEKWLEKNENGTREQFAQWSYRNTLDYLNGMVELFREEGLTQPVVWNCGWPRLIQGKEEVFRAIADSDVDAVSFCNYPGQDDLKHPFWKYPENLSTNNYLPYLQRCYEQEDWLGWLRSEAFADKAKLVYEFETMCNQSAYLYPAMARLFRSLDAQVAALWTYGLTGYATHLGGTHVFNLQTTPRKAAAFMVGGQVFKGSDAEISYEQDSCAGFRDGSLIYSGWSDGAETLLTSEMPPRKVVGFGNSPFVHYDGTGLYFIEPEESGSLRLTVYPDAEFIRPHWYECRAGEPVVKLDFETPHSFALSMPGYGASRRVYRNEGARWMPVNVESDGETMHFMVHAGEYMIEKAPEQMFRKILEEENK